LGKAAIATPLYLSFAWTLMISYQMFTQTAVTTIMGQVNMFWPLIGTWLSSRIDMIVFIYAFAWVFVLSSVIPSVILGKGRSVLLQFMVCLTLTFLAFIFQDALAAYATKPLEDLLSLTAVFQNPILAAGYLSMPYILMLILDIYSKRKYHKDEKPKTIEPPQVEYTSVEEQETQEARIPAT
jgi:hypothetical protein